MLQARIIFTACHCAPLSPSSNHRNHTQHYRPTLHLHTSLFCPPCLPFVLVKMHSAIAGQFGAAAAAAALPLLQPQSKRCNRPMHATTWRCFLPAPCFSDAGGSSVSAVLHGKACEPAQHIAKTHGGKNATNCDAAALAAARLTSRDCADKPRRNAVQSHKSRLF